jgi:hypothetical protein
LRAARLKLDRNTCVVRGWGQRAVVVDHIKRLRFELDDGCINLVPIMTHELGHAFGLNHFDEGFDACLDGQPVFPVMRWPRPNATPWLWRQSSNSRSPGAAPGILKFVSSSGIKPSAD